MPDGIVFIDNEFVSPEHAKMSIFDVGFVWGDTAYDVTSTWKNWFFMLEEHLDRFQRSCDRFQLKSPYSRDEIRQICAECVQRSGFDDSYVKLQMSRGVMSSRTVDPRLSDSAFVAYAIPYVWIWGEEKCRNGANLYLSSFERVSSRAVDQRIKNYNRADLVQARFQALDEGCDDSILCGPDGYLTEGSGYNLLVVKNGRVASPDYNVLEGVTRGALSELCKLENIPFELRKIHPDELAEADEVFASTTAGGVMPVTRISNQPVANGEPGPVTRRLQASYWGKREQGWRGTRVDEILATPMQSTGTH
ncbi:MAG: branched-chain amino acid transferase [Proteobacteria bacterium]|jgi:branched-chain amino acid aminotransferase|nr:branched-chain amino acid transferase [Pseudomonadota bacterium]MDP6135991.1 aminotransferase class IV [Arenicellales bacterium]MDP6392087.1 aminotransferase class IV [Arenicellales bacterium]MDP7219971.1 aminotransferase class IV [Arenicellales bacterium]|tara:strand:- start:8269 stop:9189 length:921 start_codon:yes stop_codon:yes gene_type:complete